MNRVPDRTWVPFGHGSTRDSWKSRSVQNRLARAGRFRARLRAPAARSISRSSTERLFHESLVDPCPNGTQVPILGLGSRDLVGYLFREERTLRRPEPCRISSSGGTCRYAPGIAASTTSRADAGPIKVARSGSHGTMSGRPSALCGRAQARWPRMGGISGDGGHEGTWRGGDSLHPAYGLTSAGQEGRADRQGSPPRGTRLKSTRSSIDVRSTRWGASPLAGTISALLSRHRQRFFAAPILGLFEEACVGPSASSTSTTTPQRIIELAPIASLGRVERPRRRARLD